jgi:hypothetical protein
VASTSNRLTAAAGPLPAKSYLYDNAGNMTSNGTATLTYSDRGRLSKAVVGTKVSVRFSPHCNYFCFKIKRREPLDSVVDLDVGFGLRLVSRSKAAVGLPH